MWAAFIEKGGLKRVTLITMVLAGISLIAYGNSVNVVMYAISLVCVVTFINAFACNCGFAIVANSDKVWYCEWYRNDWDESGQRDYQLGADRSF
jgi:hypothetical protein